MKTERGILAIWHDIDTGQSDAVLDWYNNEHHFERLSVPGFRMVHRYSAVEGAPHLFINYETDDVSVLSSPAYLERLNAPTPWTLTSQPHFRNNSRTVCHRSFAWGRPRAGMSVCCVSLPRTRRRTANWMNRRCTRRWTERRESSAVKSGQRTAKSPLSRHARKRSAKGRTSTSMRLLLPMPRMPTPLATRSNCCVMRCQIS